MGTHCYRFPWVPMVCRDEPGKGARKQCIGESATVGGKELAIGVLSKALAQNIGCSTLADWERR